MASERRVVIVGKTGNGKSSLGNSLLGRRGFEEAGTFDAVTLVPKLEANVPGLTVVDTPGLFDTRDDPKKVVSGALAIVGALDLCPNPDAFLIVFNGSSRFTEEEMSVIDILRISFGNDWIKHAIVVITKIDNDVQDSEFENKWKSCEKLRILVKQCGGRVARINNKNPREEHIEKILKNIDQVSNNGMVSYKYSYIECSKDVLTNMAKLETYNGMTTHQIVLQLATSISDKVRKEIERQEAIAEAAIKKEKERVEAERIHRRKTYSAFGSAAAGVITVATAGVIGAVTMNATVPMIIAGSISSGGVVGAVALGVLFYFYVH